MTKCAWQAIDVFSTYPMPKSNNTVLKRVRGFRPICFLG
nr:MAG TPA: hypothetical protein [Caudoviricetes sp.]